MNRSIFYIKLVHSVLFFLILISTVYLLYAVVFDRITLPAWIAFGVVCTEMVVLLINNWECPLTGMAERKGASSGAVADLFLPKWFSDRLFGILITVFALICLLLLWRVFLQ